MADTTTENERIARMVPEDIATDGNFDVIDEVVAEDVVEHGPFGQEARGIDAWRESIQAFRDGFSDFTATVEDAVTQDDLVALRVTLSGTHDGEFMGVAPTNRSFEVQNLLFTRIEDGKIVERWVQPDSLGMLQQLDIVAELGDVAAPA